MKSNIHPTYYPNTQIICTCGNTFLVGSTKKIINADVCYKCHPFYTGEHRYLDIKGRVDTFQKKQQIAKQHQIKTKNKKDKKGEKEEYRPKTLRELLQEK